MDLSECARDLTDSQAVRAEMERVLASSRFAKSGHLSRLLRFLVERHVSGGPAPDERDIATQVFGRPPATFVRELDPIVPVQHRRLRAALLAYYEAAGYKNSVVLGAPQRGYGLVVLDPSTLRPTHRKAKMALYLALAAAIMVCAGLWFHFRPHRTNPRAVQLDRRARDLRAKGPADRALSARLFRQAVALDSGYAPAWSGLAAALLSPESAGDMTRFEAFDKAQEAAAKAVKLDPKIGEAHAVLAYVRFVRGSDWAGAEPEFRLAIRLDPAAPGAHRLYAQGLISRGRFDEAIAQSETAARLAPAGSPPSTDLAEILCAARRYEEAAVEARRIVRETSGAPGARTALGIVLAAAGHYDEAIQEFQTALLSGGSLYTMARLGYAYGAKGDQLAARAILDRLDEAFSRYLSIDWSYRAIIYAGLGDNRHTVDCLEKSLLNQEGDINFIGVDPAYDRIRFDPRFISLRTRLGLP